MQIVIPGDQRCRSVCCNPLPDDLEVPARDAPCPDDLDLDVLGRGLRVFRMIAR